MKEMTIKKKKIDADVQVHVDQKNVFFVRC